MRRSFVLSLAVLAAMAGNAHAALDQPRLAARLNVIAAAAGLGTLGIGIRDLVDGDTMLLRGGERLPQQSVYKLAIALAAVAQAEAGGLSLDEPIHLTRAMVSPMWSPIAEEIGPNGLNLPLSDLLRRMVAISDNTASDTVLEHLGGPAAVQLVLSSKGIRGVRVDRLERELQPNVTGLGAWREELRDPDVLASSIEALPEAVRRKALSDYFADARDTATPAALLDLLARLDAGELLGEAGTRQLLDWLEQTSTGAARLRAGLPPDWRLAHKTGTGPVVLGVASAVNDVGIAYAPDGGRIAIVVLMRGATAPPAEREAAIAEVAVAVAATYR